MHAHTPQLAADVKAQFDQGLLTLFDGRAHGPVFVQRAAFLHIQHPKLQWLARHDSELGALLDMIDISQVWLTALHCFVTCS